MAEYAESQETGVHDTDERTNANTSRRPSFGLLLAGIAALLVSVWALIGPFSLDPLAGVEARWLFVIAAVVIGAVLVFSPGRRGGRR